MTPAAKDSNKTFEKEGIEQTSLEVTDLLSFRVQQDERRVPTMILKLQNGGIVTHVNKRVLTANVATNF